MKKNFLTSAVLLIVMAFGVLPVMAQSHQIEYPTLDPEDEQQVLNICELMKTDPEEADENVMKMVRRSRDKEGITAMGRLFLEKGVYPYAKLCADKVYELDAQYVPGLMLAGDVCIMRKDWGSAGQKFDEALMVDSTLTEPILKNVQVYKNINPIYAKEMLQRLKRMDPSNVEADRQLGDISYSMDEYKDAVAAYGSYYANTQEPDINAVKNYVLSLYATQDFPKALEIANIVLAKEPKDINMRRMKFYNLYETKDYQGAAAAMDYFNAGEYPDTLYNYRDYNYRGLTLEQTKDYGGALEAYNKAIKLNPGAVAVYKSLSSIYGKMGMYDESVTSYKTYVDSLGSRCDLIELFGLGRAYYNAITQGTDSVKKVGYLAEGDKVFAKIMADAPTSTLGPLWRARINNVLNATTPNDSVLAYYGETLKRLEGKDDPSTKAEALNYHAWDALQKDDEANATKYCDEILAIDPTNQMATQIKAYFKAKASLQ